MDLEAYGLGAQVVGRNLPRADMGHSDLHKVLEVVRKGREDNFRRVCRTTAVEAAQRKDMKDKVYIL